MPAFDATSTTPRASQIQTLKLAFPAMALPAGSVVTGIFADLNACDVPGGNALSAPAPGAYRSLVARFSKDGGNTLIGQSRRTADFALTTAFAYRALGGLSDDWGAGLTAADLAGGNLRLCVEVPQVSDEDSGGQRSLESARLTVYYSTPAPNPTTMSERLSEVQKGFLIAETTLGVLPAYPVPMFPGSFMFGPQPANEGKDLETQGDLLPSDYILVSQASETSLDSFITFDEIGLALASVIGKPVTTALGNGAYRHVFWLNVKAAADKLSFGLYFGDAERAERILAMVLTELGLDTTRKDHSLKGKFIGRNIEEEDEQAVPIALPAGTLNDVQVITLTGATSGTFRLMSPDTGAETADLAYNITASALSAAITGLTGIGAGNRTLSGSAGGPYTVTAAGTAVGKNLPLLEVSKNNLTTGATIAVTKSVVGGYRTFAATPVMPEKWGFYYSSDRAKLGTEDGRVKKLYGSSVSISGRYDPVYEQNPGNPSYATTAEGKMGCTFNVTVQADLVSRAMAKDLKNRTPRYVRMENVGGPIGTSGFSFRIRIDAAVKVRTLKNFKQEQKIYAREFELGARFDPTWGQALVVTLENDVPAYPLA